MDEYTFFIFASLYCENKVLSQLDDPLNSTTLHEALVQFDVGDVYYKVDSYDPNLNDFLENAFSFNPEIVRKLRNNDYITTKEYVHLKQRRQSWIRNRDVFSDFYLTVSQTKGIKQFLEEYVSLFNQDKLKPVAQNVYATKKQFEFTLDQLKNLEESYGNNFVVKRADIFQARYLTSDKLNKDQAYRPIEVLMSYHFQGHLNLSEFQYLYNDRDNIYNYRISVELLKNTVEIKDTIKNWIRYGSLRVLKGTQQAYYKTNFKNYRNKDSKVFKLLMYLLKHHGVSISIKELQEKKILKRKDLFEPQIELENLVKDLKRDLGIKKDENQSVDIVTSKGSVLLSSI